jgi:hypothetical protein
MGVDWRMGAEWFETWLLDYDLASNYSNWTYGAGQCFPVSLTFSLFGHLCVHSCIFVQALQSDVHRSEINHSSPYNNVYTVDNFLCLQLRSWLKIC